MTSTASPQSSSRSTGCKHAFDYGTEAWHSVGGCRRRWRWLRSRNIRGLAKKFRVLAVDELADGMTDAPKDDKDACLR